MARVKSTAHPVGGTTCSSDEDRGNGGSEERTESARLSDTGSRSKASGVVDGSRSFLFGPLTMTVSRICGMIHCGYFVGGMGNELREETVLEPQPDKAVVFEEFFNAGLRMPSHPVLADILLKFQVQIHQLTPNAIVQLSKYIWAVSSFGGVPSAKGFMKRYELHYQLRKIDVDGVELLLQYGCLNFHTKRGGQRAKLTVAVPLIRIMSPG
jgi:hypothetical protein